jgi:hypothetical protein
MGIEAHLLPLEHMTIYEQFKAFRFAFLCLILFLPPPLFFFLIDTVILTHWLGDLLVFWSASTDLDLAT